MCGNAVKLFFAKNAKMQSSKQVKLKQEVSFQDAILTFRHSSSEQIDLDFRKSQNIDKYTISVAIHPLLHASFMPKRPPFYRWRICSGCMGISSSHTPSRKERLPDINHREVVKRALHIYQLGMISKEEYLMIVQGDLKYRSQALLHDSSPTPVRGDVDPITLEPFSEHTFLFIPPRGHPIKYNLESLVAYIIKTGDFRDPVSRLPFTLDDIKTIDTSIKTAKFPYPSLVDIITNRACYESAQRQKEVLAGLESCLGELVTEMLHIIENASKYDIQDVRLICLLSEFEVPFMEMKAMSLEHAYHALHTWKVFLKGPPRRPTKQNQYLSHVLSFLTNQWSKHDDEKLKELRNKASQD